MAQPEFINGFSTRSHETRPITYAYMQHDAWFLVVKQRPNKQKQGVASSPFADNFRPSPFKWRSSKRLARWVHVDQSSKKLKNEEIHRYKEAVLMVGCIMTVPQNPWTVIP